jgi:hypothetical protein
MCCFINVQAINYIRKSAAMWQHRFETTSTLAPEDIWPVIANIAGWAEVDHNIDRICIDKPAAVGVRFTLKPKGGPTLKFIIGDFTPPGCYSDICKLPFASMKTLHTLQAGDVTAIRVDIQITGPLAKLWGIIVGRKHAAGLPAQTQRILAKAMALKRG